MSWNEYLSTIDEVETYQKKVKRSRAKDFKTYYQGDQDPGEPYTEKPTKGKGSGPPGFGAMGEEVDQESFQIHNELAPHIWSGQQLSPEVRERLLEIVQDFMEKLPEKVEIKDIRLTGSLANYNWSKYSDVDLHVIVDYSEMDENDALVKAFFDAQRMRWNDTHDINVFDYEVEIYVENLHEQHLSGGVYSIMDEQWIREPLPYEGEIDFATARKKSDDIATQVNLIGHTVRAGKYKGALRSIERLKAKIRRMRKAGLESTAREYSPENIAFKILRRDGTLKKLNDLKHSAYDKEMSLPEKEDGIS